MDYFILLKKPPCLDVDLIACRDAEGVITLLSGDKIAISVENNGYTLINLVPNDDDVDNSIEYMRKHNIFNDYTML